MALEVEWDDAKTAYNLRKHGVSFEDAMWAFADPGRVELLDDREDYGEDRWMTIGRADPALLIVVHAVRGSDGSGHTHYLGPKSQSQRARLLP